MTYKNKKKLFSRVSPRIIQVLLALTNILLVLVVIAFAWLFHEAARARAESIPQQIHQRSQQFQQRMVAFFAPVVDDLGALRSMALKRVISLDESDAGVTRAVVTATIKKPSLAIDGFVLADTQGREFKWIKTEDQWRQVASEDDIRTCPWFKSALQLEDPNEVLTSGVYTFHSRQKPGVTLARSYTLSDDKTQYVIAFDIAVDDFVNFALDMEVPEEGQLLLYSGQRIADLKQYAALMEEGSAGEADFWKNLSDVKDSIAVAAVSVWIKEGAPLETPLTFSHGNKMYWAEFEDMVPDSQKTQIVVLVPELAMIHTARRAAIWLFAVTGVGLMIAAVLLGISLRRQSRVLDEQLSYIGHIGESEQQLLATIATGENNSLEFKSTLRWHLRANKPAKEIEIACMKTLAAFLNSDGGTLLVGVEDDGTIFGIEQDGFNDDDKFLLHFNNLLKHHLGLECVPFVTFEIKHIEGKSVLVVDCRPSPSPVFVRHGDREDFYIRVGPGTRQLATSEVLAYIQGHFR